MNGREEPSPAPQLAWALLCPRKPGRTWVNGFLVKERHRLCPWASRAQPLVAPGQGVEGRAGRAPGCSLSWLCLLAFCSSVSSSVKGGDGAASSESGGVGAFAGNGLRSGPSLFLALRKQSHC